MKPLFTKSQARAIGKAAERSIHKREASPLPEPAHGSSEPVTDGLNELDGKRWRALMRCGRIKMQGSAGVDPHTLERRNGSNVHFGAEFWPEPLPLDYRDEHPQAATMADWNTRWGLACLTALADAIIERDAALSIEGPVGREGAYSTDIAAAGPSACAAGDAQRKSEGGAS